MEKILTIGELFFMLFLFGMAGILIVMVVLTFGGVLWNIIKMHFLEGEKNK